MSLKKEKEYESIVSDILDNPKFKSLINEPHHGISRYEHSLRVSLLTYKIALMFNMKNIKSITRASLLHDFYNDSDLEGLSSYERLRAHPYVALYNAKMYFDINALESDMIVKHMFPHTHSLPKYKESYLLTITDKIVAVYEMSRFKLVLKLNLGLVVLYNFVNVKLN